MTTITMIQRIEEERKDQKLGEIKELNLDGCNATEIEGLTDEYSSLEKLSIADVGLTTLAGFPALPKLVKLDLSGNPITEGLDALSKCTNLTTLNLSGNKLASIKDLAPLASLENLSHLELSNCELVSEENYRKEVFALLPQLSFLDGLDQNGEEESDVKASGDGVNGSNNGHAGHDEEDENDAEDETEEDDEEEIGLSALQGSKELESDEEDYVPGDEEEEEPELEDEEEDEEDSNVEEELPNLSDAGVTGPRRAQKRAAEDDGEDVSDAKIPATEDMRDCFIPDSSVLFSTCPMIKLILPIKNQSIITMATSPRLRLSFTRLKVSELGSEGPCCSLRLRSSGSLYSVLQAFTYK
nr:hypothetical transcript [Hymenolepis microstoma]